MITMSMVAREMRRAAKAQDFDTAKVLRQLLYRGLSERQAQVYNTLNPKIHEYAENVGLALDISHRHTLNILNQLHEYGLVLKVPKITENGLVYKWYKVSL